MPASCSLHTGFHPDHGRIHGTPGFTTPQSLLLRYRE